MGSLNVQEAAGTLASQDFISTAVAVLVGSIVAQLATSFARENVYDMDMFAGDDAVYAFAVAFVVILAGQVTDQQEHANNAALGAALAGIRVALDEAGVL